MKKLLLSIIALAFSYSVLAVEIKGTPEEIKRTKEWKERAKPQLVEQDTSSQVAVDPIPLSIKEINAQQIDLIGKFVKVTFTGIFYMQQLDQEFYAAQLTDSNGDMIASFFKRDGLETMMKIYRRESAYTGGNCWAYGFLMIDNEKNAVISLIGNRKIEENGKVSYIWKP